MSGDGERREDSNDGRPKITRVYTRRRRRADRFPNVESLEVVNSQSEGNVDRLYLPPLSDEIALTVLARVPLTEQAKLGFVNKRYLDLARSGEIYHIRREIGVQEPLVFLYVGDGPNWWAVDPRSGRLRGLPPLPSDYCFQMADKETFSVWTHFLVTGRMLEGMATFRYELHTNKWFMGPSMITRRCLFASANCGDFVCVAGGIKVVTDLKFSFEDRRKMLLNSAERYCPRTKSWEPLPEMNCPRKLCSGVFMDNKFYVIGGVDENTDGLTSGECYDVEKNTWELVPDMLSSPQISHGSPPLLAVANNNLYMVDSSTNELKVYVKETKSWMVLGDTPVRSASSSGWGVAFKSLGKEELLLIGAQHPPERRGQLVIFTCRPEPGEAGLHWQRVEAHGNHWNDFIYQCSTMFA